MTPTRYFLARAALAFGISRKQRRMSAATSETHLLRESEQLLGQRIWNRAEAVEELGIEYWNLRRLMTDKTATEEKLQEAEAILHEAHEHRATLLGDKSATHEELSVTRAEMLSVLDELARERDEIVRQARGLRRLYDGLKMKLEVLKSEARQDDEITESTRTRMGELRSQFEALKVDRDKIAEKIAEKNADLDKVDEKLDTEQAKHRAEAGEAFQMIAEANRKISSYKAELGLINTQMNQLYSEVGRHISRNIKVNASCREASAEFRPMVEVMAALRRSILLNHKLAGK